jgi:hypothetical protein
MNQSCDYTGNDFGATYPDSICINGYLWDMDSGYNTDDGWVYTSGGELRCPQCNNGISRDVLLYWSNRVWDYYVDNIDDNNHWTQITRKRFLNTGKCYDL